ncbi:alanine racemase [Amphibacillus sp. Q70]|uniref:alanine racemase n=1 Tax=Amphibacillus sp. Q70 TaxID=3453416 RepID=UPI003F82D03B
MKSTSYRPAKIEINLSAIKANIQQLQLQLGKDTQVIAVVKANGYGHGDIQVAKTALEAGATSLAVALLDEAVKLRKAGIKAPILVLGWVAPEFIEIAIEYDITLTVFQVNWLNEYYHQASDSKKLSIHIKLDTGMGRIGIRTMDELEQFLENINEKYLDVTGVFTHFATADEESLDYYRLQLQRFAPMLEKIKERINQDIFVHIGNSAAALRQESCLFNAVRFGIGMYGLYPSQYIEKNRPFKLEPALSIKAKLTHVKKISAGEAISYGATYRAEEEEWIGTIPIGYGDGIQRKWQGLDVLIDGKRMPLIGRICMDQCMVRLDHAYPMGTEVTFIGGQGNERISLEEIALQLDTINYELACLFTERLPRFYY